MYHNDGSNNRHDKTEVQAESCRLPHRTADGAAGDTVHSSSHLPSAGSEDEARGEGSRAPSSARSPACIIVASAATRSSALCREEKVTWSEEERALRRMAHNVTLALTLPITCHICLGKVREPVICANYHVFCSICIELWLKNNSQCPACRVPITRENPCKNIIGGISEDEGKLTHSGRKHLRKTRLELLQKEYEDEIDSLVKEIEELKRHNLHLEERHSDAPHPAAISISCNCAIKETEDGRGNICDSLLEEWNRKLEMVNAAYKQVQEDIETLKEENQKLRNENIECGRENLRLKNEVDLRSPQKFGRFTVAALQAKVDQYEREMSRLKKALERSDQYIEELEAQVEHLKKSPEDTQKEKSQCGNAAQVHDATTTRTCEELNATQQFLNQTHKTRVSSEDSISNSSASNGHSSGSPELKSTFTKYSPTLINGNEQISILKNSQSGFAEFAESYGSPTSSLPFSSLLLSTPDNKPNSASNHGHLKKPLTYLRKLVFADLPNRKGVSNASNSENNLNTGEDHTSFRESKPSFLNFCQINCESEDIKLPLQREIGLQKDNGPDQQKYTEGLKQSRVLVENSVELSDYNVNEPDIICSGRRQSSYLDNASSKLASKVKFQVESTGKVGKDSGDNALSQQGGEPIASCSSAVRYGEYSQYYMKPPRGAVQDKNFQSHLSITNTLDCNDSSHDKEQLMLHSASGVANSMGSTSHSSRLPHCVPELYSNSPPAKRKMISQFSDSPCK
ncbi:ORC ubiquitin ligase 1 [Dendrobates tinctorius]|uniref:ORC ubiquitin ligase 1 n=1 Tax=Dendrobates tinctorius TaxID=92724 RepID=UPI003CC9F8D4